MSETPVHYDAGYQSLQAEYDAARAALDKANADVELAYRRQADALRTLILVEGKLNALTPPPTWSEAPPPTWSQG